MKRCIICKQEILSGQSKRGTGTGYAHLYCLIPKKVKPTPRLSKSGKNH